MMSNAYRSTMNCAAGGAILNTFAMLPAGAADEAASYPARPIRIVVPY